jgi:hypothetical protein
MNDFRQKNTTGLHAQYYRVAEIVVVLNQLLTQAADR